MIAFYDTECYPNYWVLKIRSDYGYSWAFSLRAGESLSQAHRQDIDVLMQRYTVVSFNGIDYDVPMICAALSGYTCEQLKWLNDKIIPSKEDEELGIKGLKYWEVTRELGLPDWKPRDHIDIQETLPGAGSQKVYAGRIHCKTMRDLPYGPDKILTDAEITQVDIYCENDLAVLGELYDAALPLIQMREEVGRQYGLELRSKSDAQCGEAIIKRRCEEALGYKIYKAEVDWGMAFRYEPPAWLEFRTPALQAALTAAKDAVFTLSPTGAVVMPEQLEGLKIPFGGSVYRLGIGGLHSSEKHIAHHSTETHVLRDVDVASYYPNLMINSGKYPKATGPQFIPELAGLKAERLGDKKDQKRLESEGLKGTPEWFLSYCRNEGKKVFINGIFGKTLSIYSPLFAPEMGIQTTVTGQLALLMLVELHELYGIPAVSANTDGIVFLCPRTHVETSEALVRYWEQLSGLEMEASEYIATYSRDINNYFAVKPSGEVKRKGAYAKADLVLKKSPDVEICSDAVTEYLSKGTPMLYTIAACEDIRKFVTVQKVSGGAVKLWGEGPRKGCLVRDMIPVLLENGWEKAGRFKWKQWAHDVPTTGVEMSAADAYKLCFPHPQVPEYLGKCIRWYYGANAPGPIIYNNNGNTVSLSYGAQPCMVLPAVLPADIDYAWYLATAEGMLKDVGYSVGK